MLVSWNIVLSATKKNKAGFFWKAGKIFLKCRSKMYFFFKTEKSISKMVNDTLSSSPSPLFLISPRERRVESQWILKKMVLGWGGEKERDFFLLCPTLAERKILFFSKEKRKKVFTPELAQSKNSTVIQKSKKRHFEFSYTPKKYKKCC